MMTPDSVCSLKVDGDVEKAGEERVNGGRKKDYFFRKTNLGDGDSEHVEGGSLP